MWETVWLVSASSKSPGRRVPELKEQRWSSSLILSLVTALHDESEAQFDLQAPATGNKDGLLVQEELEVEKMIGDNYWNSYSKL